MDSTDKYIGVLLDNRYEILERIGTGGMAYVYKARCHRLNRLVAVKILKEELAGNEEFRRRFHTESQAVAMLSHPNIVAVYDVSRSGNIEYIVMELIEGITLKQYINRKGLLNWKESLHFATQIAKALSHAHSKGIIHRDIKPHNTMILKDGSVKVADFGIAQLLTMQNTLTQEALGSVHYISPEQAKGGHVDARTDIYSVGVVMYEMLTSHLPFVGDSAVSIAIQHISAMPLMPRDINPDIPEGLENITMHAMEADLSLRYATADEMLLDLEEFRKNPAAVFRYAASEALASEREELHTTKSVPQSGIIDKMPVAVGARRAVRTRRRPEMTRDEYRGTRRRASQTSTLIGVMAIIVFIIIVCVFMWTYFFKDMLNPDTETIKIHSFIGSKYSDILGDPEYAQYYNFLEPEYKSSDSYAEGYVVEQE
ncbi:MAG: protein kinase, partial [Oscillospiraceae bacterium]|nr:protein kinase [Oscillospiraceae bacterium]